MQRISHGVSLLVAGTLLLWSRGSFADSAELLQDNPQALETRLALLQNAPKGTKVRIATFLFDYGRSSRELTARLCRSAQRGVDVELLVDSKSGDHSAILDAFDGEKNVRRAEELYQYMANCGVKVFIHNPLTDFVQIFGYRLPNIFYPGQVAGKSVGIFKILGKLKQLKARLSASAKPYDIRGVLQRIQGLTIEITHLQDIAGQRARSDRDNASNLDPVEQSISNLSSQFRGLVSDPVWSGMAAQDMRELVGLIQTALFADPVLNEAREKIHIFSRLNHRKLFLFLYPDGSSCQIIGSRNIGDNYFTEDKGAYYDGDLLTCQGKASATLADRALKSFEDLKNNSEDKSLLRHSTPHARMVEVDRGYKFKLINPRALMTRRVEQPRGIPLKNFENSQLLTTGWDSKSDQVRQELLASIQRERKELYLETPYAQFGPPIRKALEDALKRGVRVRIRTNGIFQSDGPSKLIRILMARWNERLHAKYPRLFEVEFVSAESKYMLHFKGAGFRCQKIGDTLFRGYLVGSHNFHPRSGMSDKEHALYWNEPTSDCAPPAEDLITLRDRYYARMQKKQGRILVAYPNLYSELISAARNYKDLRNSDMARGLMRSLFNVSDEGRHVEWVRSARDGTDFFALGEEGGLFDLFGYVF